MKNITYKKEKKHWWDVGKDIQDLRCDLLSLLHKRFRFYTQLKIGQLKQTHLLKGMRREIARIKFYLSKNR